MRATGFQRFRRRAPWGSQFGAATFLVICAYLKGTYVFTDTYWAGNMAALAFVAYLVTLVLGLVSLPRWQGFAALAVCAYATYWFTTPLYAIGCN